MKLAGLVVVLAACSGADEPEAPTKDELYGSWVSTTLPGETHLVTFSPEAPSDRPELAGREDVYVYQVNSTIEGTGTFLVVPFTGAARDENPELLGGIDMPAIGGTRAGGNFGSYIVGYTGDTYTLYREVIEDNDTAGDLVYIRQ